VIRALKRRVSVDGRSVVKGIGDDCAIVRPRTGFDLLVTTDFLIEDVHFLRKHSPEDVGWKTLARGLSDIAAMGGDPRWCLVSLALPRWAKSNWVSRFYDGLFEHGVPLVGGDLSRADRVLADIVVLGEIPCGKALRRDSAGEGDAIFVSGELGKPWHQRPKPRLDLGRWLRGRATACMDLSDGLSIDLHRMCIESGVAAIVDRPLPVSHGATIEQALHGGEDYELLFTTRARLSRFAGLPLTRIGTVVKGKPGSITFFGQPLEPKGYDHFR